jgi:hypothetical protein
VGQRSDEIKKHIDTQRSELSENLERLEERVKSTTDWRAQVEKRPMTALGIAFGGGLLLGTMLPGMAHRRSKYRTAATQAYTETSQGYTGSSEGTTGSYLLEQARRAPKKTATSKELRKTWDMLDTIRASMVAFGATKLKNYLGSAIPGFGDQYKRTEEEKRRERAEDYPSQGVTGTGTTSPQTPSYTTSPTGQS